MIQIMIISKPEILFSRVTDFLQAEVFPYANQLDTDAGLLLQTLKKLLKLGALRLKIPKKFGGWEFDDINYGRFQSLVASYSGALAFLQTQHQSAVAMLVKSDNCHLQRQYLPRIVDGEVLVGVGFSHLRRSQVTVKAKSVNGGYVLDGVVPWITGWGMFSDFIVAATLRDGSAVFGIVPLENTQQRKGGSLQFNDPADLMAMPATNTVSATLSNWFLSQDQVVFTQPPGWIGKNDQKNVLKATFLMMGCAQAGLRVIADKYQQNQLDIIHTAHSQLQQELHQCGQKIEQAIIHPKSFSYPQKLEMRSWAINLMHRITQAAIAVSSGAANYYHHPAQRIYREALVFSVTGQTEDITAATLARLTKSPIPETQSQIIHLSHVINTNMPQWPDDPATKFTSFADIEQQGYFLRELCIGEHSATHMNVPRSFYPDGTSIDKYPAAKLVLAAVTIDIRRLVEQNPDYLLTVADIQAWEHQHGIIPPHSLVLLNTGWSQKWHNPTEFMNADEHGKMHFPGFSLAVSQFLLEQRHINGVGIDTHGVDGGSNTDFSVNRLILSQPRIVLENLTNLDQLPPVGTTVVIAPLRLRGGSGSPLGIVAIVGANIPDPGIVATLNV
ncbi:cyclase family protein [Calothrix sp. NIES-3974]|uniref:cyclase family protein n=1 Tax=Calothrix sp. NIES-3974 TaxID=2005462 RepID=UPI001E637A24|nr:cyclase family protein [Calothrix sp. NIES-3974]